jgi:Reverse transcriptase (RNA-dependent DNA polymerase)
MSMAELGHECYLTLDCHPTQQTSDPMFSFDHLAACVTISGDRIPRTYTLAKSSHHWDDWKTAMDRQMHQFNEMDIYEELLQAPIGAKVLPGKWVYDIKRDMLGKIIRYRARWVVCGNFQDKEDIDTYAAVAHMTSVRIFLLIVAIDDLECEQVDVVSAFLNALMKNEVVFVMPPTGFRKGKEVWRLKKALYGLRQSPLLWYREIVEVLKQLGFEPLDSELCLFRNSSLGLQKPVFLLLFVDDMLIAAESTDLVARVKYALSQHFELKELGDVSLFLGLEVHRNRRERSIFLTQRQYTVNMLKELDQEHLHPVAVPLLPATAAKLRLPATSTNTLDPDELQHYASCVGKVNWLSGATRPDITFTCNKLGEGQSRPTSAHWDTFKHLCRYLAGTQDYGITLGGPQWNMDDVDLHVHADASLGDVKPHCYSTGGHVVMATGSPIFWKSKRQSFVSSSTTEAEFCNLMPAGQTLIWIDRIFRQAGFPQRQPLLLFSDSQNAIATTLSLNYTARTRHIDLRFKWVIDQVHRKIFKILHVGTAKMIADGFTKALNPEKFRGFLNNLNFGRSSWALPQLSFS